MVEADFLIIGVENLLITSRPRLFRCGSSTPGKAGRLCRRVMRSTRDAEPYRPPYSSESWRFKLKILCWFYYNTSFKEIVPVGSSVLSPSPSSSKLLKACVWPHRTLPQRHFNSGSLIRIFCWCYCLCCSSFLFLASPSSSISVA